jgi:hypothetical protein
MTGTLDRAKLAAYKMRVSPFGLRGTQMGQRVTWTPSVDSRLYCQARYDAATRHWG